MSSPPIHTGMSLDTKVVEARINNVNTSDYTVDVTTVRTMQIITDLPISVPYTHYLGGEGMYGMPDVGALVWICFPSDGDFPFVLGFSAPSDTGTGSFKANRKKLEMGDQVIMGRPGNMVYVQKNGIVEIASTPLARRLYIPVDNLIRDIAQNYKMNVVGGNWQWLTAKDSDDPSGKVPIKFLLGVKEFADDKRALVTLEMAHGVTPDDSELLSDTGEIKSDVDLTAPAVRFSVYEQGEHIKKVAVVEFEKNGAVKYTTEGDYIINSQGDIKLTSLTGKMELNATTEMVIKGLVSMSMTSPQIALNSPVITLGYGVSVKQGVIESPNVIVGSSVGNRTSLLKETILTYLSTHTHQDMVTGALTGPPLNAAAMIGDKATRTTSLLGA